MSYEADKMDLSENTAPSTEEKEPPSETGEEDRMEEEISQEDMRARRLAKFSALSSQSKPIERNTPSADEQFSMDTGSELPTAASSKRASRSRAERSSLSQLSSSPGAAHKYTKGRSISQDKPEVSLTSDEVCAIR